MTLSMEQIVNTLEKAGYSHYTVDPQYMPTYNKAVVEDFEDKVERYIERWCSEEISMYLIPEPTWGGLSHDVPEWETPDPGHRFHVEVTDMTVDDVYYTLGEHVVYCYYLDEYSLEVGAEVISVTKTDNGLRIEIAITHFRDEQEHSEWSEWASDGFLSMEQQVRGAIDGFLHVEQRGEDK